MTVSCLNKLNKLTNQCIMIFCKCLHLAILTKRPIYSSTQPIQIKNAATQTPCLYPAV